MSHEFNDFHRGEIYFADLNPVYGHEQGGVRPVLVLQNDVGNYFSPTLIVTQATRRTYKKLRTIDKRRIIRYAGKLTDEQMGRIDAALRRSLQLRDEDFLPTEVEAP